MKNKVRFYREKNNLTQTVLAEKSGLSLRTIQRIENGSELKGYTLESLAKTLNVKPDNLINEKIDLEKVKIINISTLSFCIIPFGNIILPAILTFKSKNEKTKSIGKDILNIQIIWTIITSILLIICPFIQNWLQINIPLLIIILIALICINIFIVFKNSISLTNNSELYIILKIKLL
ncbi:helix-turn-helix domain-containing protein [Maribacter sp. 4G9]|uniref:helix-turn-helix domain-containing protein n=1 Tax=Maribacter sp. 4G9 TaxID=1889777 RepID=UPI000C15C3DC|nr:helix-turn-helix domain-containing protein [Maribacter sp. 4G9]PIB38536.1 XRE family transcriptional regulator [Maribacter sp. 4G9]|tara:strand:- start:728 stop:1261 length:534 start_codon:yes stop_codon:yes gene_type:complete